MWPLVIQLLGSVLRTFLPAASAYLAGIGIPVLGSTTMTIVVAVVIYLAMQLWSIIRKFAASKGVSLPGDDLPQPANATNTAPIKRANQ